MGAVIGCGRGGAGGGRRAVDAGAGVWVTCFYSIRLSYTTNICDNIYDYTIIDFYTKLYLLGRRGCRLLRDEADLAAAVLLQSTTRIYEYPIRMYGSKIRLSYIMYHSGTSSGVLVATSSAMRLILSRPCFSAPLRNLE